MPVSSRTRRITSTATVCLVAAAYLVARVAATISIGPTASPDSPWYRDLDLSGRGRPWTTPLLHFALPDDRWRIAAQALVAGLGWLYCASEVARLTHGRATRVAAAACVLAVGTSPHVTYWDRVIYSESLTITLGIAAFAALLGRRPIAAAALLFLWVLNREANVPLAAIPTAAFVLAAVRTRRRDLAVAAAIVWLAVTVGLVLHARNETGVAVGDPGLQTEIGPAVDTLTPNLAGVIEQRIVPHPDRLEFFEERGFRRSTSKPDLLLDPVVRAWISERGQRTYALFLMTHPGYAALGPPVADLQQLLAPGQPLFVGSNTTDHEPPWLSLPAVLNDFLMSHLLVALLASGLAVAVAMARRLYPGLLAVALIATTWPHVLVVWHGSPIEHERHGIGAAVLLRLGVVVALFGSLGRAADRPNSTSWSDAAPT